jgi:hypothetical protein
MHHDLHISITRGSLSLFLETVCTVVSCHNKYEREKYQNASNPSKVTITATRNHAMPNRD